MRISIVAKYDGQDKNVAWVSLQPGGDISFGLNDNTFISPKFRARKFLWNAYNRVRAEYIVTSEPEALEPIRNPHFTFHPPNYFHLRESGGVSTRRTNKRKARTTFNDDDDAVFAGIQDVPITLRQQGQLPWIRAISAPLNTLRASGRRADSIPDAPPLVVSSAANISLGIAIDLLRPPGRPIISIWNSKIARQIEWHGLMVYIQIECLSAQTSTLSWFHEY